jgi:replicative DNA helicase
MAETLSDIQAEAELLGAVMIDNSVIKELGHLVSGDFFEPIHGIIFEYILCLLHCNEVANPVTLHPYLESNEALKALGGTSYLARLTAGGHGLVEPRHLAKRISDLAWRRHISGNGGAQ